MDCWLCASATRPAETEYRVQAAFLHEYMMIRRLRDRGLHELRPLRSNGYPGRAVTLI